MLVDTTRHTQYAATARDEKRHRSTETHRSTSRTHGTDPDVQRLCNARQGKRETDAKDNTKTGVDRACPDLLRGPLNAKPHTHEGPKKNPRKNPRKTPAKPPQNPRKTPAKPLNAKNPRKTPAKPPQNPRKTVALGPKP